MNAIINSHMTGNNEKVPMFESSSIKNTCSCYVWMRLQEYLVYRGFSPTKIENISKEGACFIGDELRYSLSAIDKLLICAGDHLEDELIGLKSGLYFQSLKFGLYHALLGHVDTMRLSVEMAIQYLPLETQGIRLTIRPQKDRIELIIIPVADGLTRFHLENLLSQIYCRLKGASPEWMKVQLGYSVRNTDAYADVLNCEVEAEKEYTAIIFDRAVMARDLGWKDQTVFSTLERLAKKRLSQLYSYSSTTDEVKTMARQQILYGQQGIAQIAHLMGVSERSLQKLLHSEGISYREIVGMVKLELAQELLMNTRMSSSKIAEQLGFEEVSSFYRFLKRSTGKSVVQLKEVQLKDRQSCASDWICV